MSLSYKNILDGAQLSSSLGAGDFSKSSLEGSFKKKATNTARYIKGYAQDSAIEALANSLDINKGLFKQVLGLEDKQLDAYDPYHTSDSKKEVGWFSVGGGKIDGEQVQTDYDEDTNTFKRGLYSQSEFRGTDFWFEDPFIPSFELFFDKESPFFNNNVTSSNSLRYFIDKYTSVDPNGYANRLKLWEEFTNVFFKIFQMDLKSDDNNRYLKNKTYYITKIAGLANLNKKFIKYGGTDGDKLTITMNEDVSMIAWYISELYNNLIYSYKNQRHMFPENVIRFNMTIRINEMRNYQMPIKNTSANADAETLIQNIISPKSQITYTLHDCNFNFEQSNNHGEEISIGGYVGGANSTPQELSFEIFYKSVTRDSSFPLIENLPKINAWEDKIFIDNYTKSSDNYNGRSNQNTGTLQSYYGDLDRLRTETQPASKSYANQLLGKAAQTVANNSINYMDNLESKLREVRGSAVNGLLKQFRSSVNINKIEPDNVYNADFNNRISVSNFGKQVASGLLNDLESTVRGAANF